jgi:hypothetical protein
MTKRMPKTRKQFIKVLDEMCSIYVRARDGHCVCCGSTYQLQCGHYIKRGKMRLRWDIRNCNCQCRDCNFRHNQYPHFYEGYMRRHYGDAVLDDLEKLSEYSSWKWTLEELQELHAYYSELLANIGA